MKGQRIALLLVLVLLICSDISAQSKESYRGLLTTRVRTGQLAPPEHLRTYVDAGKLHLTLRDAILLALENDSDIQVEETQIESQKFTLLAAWALFDPLLQSNLNINRAVHSPAIANCRA